MKKIVLVPALIGVMGIGGLIAVAGNNTFEAANIVEEPVKSSEQVRLSVEEIEKKALELVNGDGAVITDIEFESEGKWSHFEVEIVTKEAEYELKFDAFTGELLEKEVDRQDDDDDYYEEINDDRYDD
ncbi:PepSY domain-containing protein [Ureibacillus manganicus]|uniref:PepSY domain-containing protein n=1 Tax=Ureibacillus manganicus TaxID=1266064 RepID=UPI000691FECA|nr:PepSY domain-containing protein [Ureibacillus manganicus]